MGPRNTEYVDITFMNVPALLKRSHGHMAMDMTSPDVGSWSDVDGRREEIGEIHAS
jgi:hypothetical protein